jgi:hypothetical protein
MSSVANGSTLNVCVCVCVCVRIGVYQSMGAPAGSARTEATVLLLSSMKRLVWCFLPDDPESVRFAGSGVENPQR